MNRPIRPFSFVKPAFLLPALVAALMIASTHFASAAPTTADNQRAATICSEAGITGGVIVHLGARDGEFTAALKINDHCCRG